MARSAKLLVPSALAREARRVAHSSRGRPVRNPTPGLSAAEPGDETIASRAPCSCAVGTVLPASSKSSTVHMAPPRCTRIWRESATEHNSSRPSWGTRVERKRLAY
eukprot:scaffold240917_cov30-Tisochrysis_lutea.AAC.2